MGGILRLLVIAYLFGMGVVLAPTVQGEWDNGTASEFFGSIVRSCRWPLLAGGAVSPHDRSGTRVEPV